MQMSCDTRAGNRSKIHSDVESLSATHRADHRDGALRESHELSHFVGVEVSDIRNMPVRDDEQVACVVRVKVQHGVSQNAARNDQRVGIGPRRSHIERAHRGVVRIPYGLRLTADVGQPVRRPDAVETIRYPDRTGHIDVARLACAHTCTRRSIASRISATASAIATPFFWVPSRYRNDTAPAATSSSPAISMNGTFCFCALRIFFCIRSSESSTSNRTPTPRRASPTAPSRYGTCVSVIGMPTA